MKTTLLILFTCSFLLARTAPSFKGDLLGGGKAELKDYLKKDRSLLLCFWASWCTPCMEELKQVSEKLQKDQNLALDVLTVNVDTTETSSDVKPTLKLYQFNFPVVLDPKHEIFTKYQSTKTLPFSMLLNSHGDVVEAFNGFNEGMVDTLRNALKKKEPNAKN